MTLPEVNACPEYVSTESGEKKLVSVSRGVCVGRGQESCDWREAGRKAGVCKERSRPTTSCAGHSSVRPAPAAVVVELTM